MLALLAATAVGVTMLASGAGALETTLPGGLPLGNLVAAAVLLGPAVAARLLSRPATAARWFANMALVLAQCWLPLSVALAGNLALNFADGRGTAWLALSLVTLLAVGLALAWSGMQRLAARSAA